MTDVYEKLRAKLDTMSTGFPQTKNKSEISILKHLFSEEEAELFLTLTPFPETPEAFAERTGSDQTEMEKMMEDMAKRGLLFRLRDKESIASYSCIPYLVGIMEFQVDKLKTDTKLALDMAIYAKDGFLKSLQMTDTPHQRPVPINTEIVTKWPVAPYEDAISILKNQEKIAVANCVCRTVTKQLLPDQCDKPLETCMMFGKSAEYYIENGMGREIDFQEAESILNLCDEHAMVVQPLNSKNAGAICACCGDCCGMLISLKMEAKPAEAVKSSYFAEVNSDECIGCEVCLDRCQIEAITVDDDKASIDLDRCIGCGLCVTTCPVEAVSLMKKPEDVLYEPPEDHMDMYIRMGVERGMI